MKFKKTGEPKKRLAHYSLLILVIIFVFRVPLEGLKNNVQDLLLPIKTSIFSFTNNIKESVIDLKNYKTTMSENKKLRVEVTKLESLKNRTQFLEEENNRLRKLLDIKSNSKEKFRVAKVSFRDSITYHEQIFVDLGSNQNIKKNMVVLSNKSLIGRIKKVSKESSNVELLTKEDVYTSVISEKNNVLGVLKGDNSDTLTMENVPLDRDIEVGEKLYTSGISDIYPKGLYVGKVVSISNTSDQLFKTITVKQDFNIFDLRETIIINKE